MPIYNNYTARHWQHRASEMRLLARTVVGREAQETMLRIAQHYERLAGNSAEPAPASLPDIPPAPSKSSMNIERWLAPIDLAEPVSEGLPAASHRDGLNA